jgi:hypothetical protein
MHRIVLLVLGIVLVILAPAQVTQGQGIPGGLTCEQLVTVAVATVGTSCDALGRNQACYGNRNIEAEFRPEIQADFDGNGDLVDIAALARLRTTPFNAADLSWGIALMKAQANLPDALPGQNVTFLLFGDATLDNPTPDMRAVTLSTQLGEDVNCEETPPSALVIQAPQGSQVSLNINGADVIIGSTAWITTVDDNTRMHIATIDGIVVVSAFDIIRVVTPGSRIGMGLDENLQANEPPSELRPFDFEAISRSPLALLDEAVTIPDPIVGDPLVSTPTPTPIAGCTPRADWRVRYTIQPGDTLSSLAARLGVGLNDLAVGNCIANVSRINAGQVINVPFALPTNTPIRATNTPAVTSTATATATLAGMVGPNLRADAPAVLPGECTTIRWDVSNIREVYFEGQGVVGSGSQQVCPYQQTTYTLTVVQLNGQSVTFTITIGILPTQTPTGPVCGNLICEPGESRTCPSDCGTPVPVCGNQICEPGEDFSTCSSDCQPPIT